MVSNDSDLLEPIRIVREELGLKVGILVRIRGRAGPSCRTSISSSRFARACLEAAQFPATASDHQHGTFKKLAGW